MVYGTAVPGRSGEEREGFFYFLFLKPLDDKHAWLKAVNFGFILFLCVVKVQ